ncbi:MAG: hypothetical protein IPH20_16515 [Bacteroidales bacterium]|nr:hypothetical protein [Bacteroidales bacterium]
MGLDKSVHVLQMGSGVAEIANMVTIAVIDAQSNNNDSRENAKTYARRTCGKILEVIKQFQDFRPKVICNFLLCRCVFPCRIQISPE